MTSRMKKIALGVAAAAALLTAVPAFAHHPFASEFDWKKPVTLTGTVTKVAPDCWRYDAAGSAPPADGVIVKSASAIPCLVGFRMMLTGILLSAKR